MRQFHVKSKDIADVEQTMVMRGHIKICTKKGFTANGTRSSRERIEYAFVEGSQPIGDDTFRVAAGQFRKETPYS